MARKGPIKKAEIIADTKFNNKVVSKFINAIMLDGKKSVAETVIYDSFKIIQDKAKSDPLEVFEEAMKNIQPPVEVRSRRVGGATYQVPVEVNPARKQSLAIRWILSAAKKEQEKVCPLNLLLNLWMLKKVKVALLRKKKTQLKWQKLIGLSHIIDGRLVIWTI